MLRVLQELQAQGDNTNSNSNLERLSITEASLLDLSNEDLQQLVQDCDAVVSCLGNNLDFNGLFGHPRRLVTDATKRLTNAMMMMIMTAPTKRQKFILMGTAGVANPNGQDDKRPLGERAMLFLLHHFIADNEDAAAYLYSLGNNSSSNADGSSAARHGGNDNDNAVEWSVIRPTNLVDGEPTGNFQIHDKPQKGLFTAGHVTRSHVAQCMTQFILDDDKWNQYKFQMPVLHDVTVQS